MNYCSSRVSIEARYVEFEEPEVEPEIIFGFWRRSVRAYRTIDISHVRDETGRKSHRPRNQQIANFC